MANHQRLREERERLGMTQLEFGSIGGVLKQAQHRYETGTRKPDIEYLVAIAAAGADVLYILTGQRSSPMIDVQLLPPRERALLNDYRACGDDAKRIIEGSSHLGSQLQSES